MIHCLRNCSFLKGVPKVPSHDHDKGVDQLANIFFS